MAQGNLELIAASMERLAELLEEHGGIDGAVKALHLPFDDDSAQFFMPTMEELVMLVNHLEFETGEIGGRVVMAMAVTDDFGGHIGAMQARSFLLGYVAAKMESGDL